MGIDRGPISATSSNGSPTNGSTVGGGRHSVDSAVGSAVARLAGGRVWSLGNDLRLAQRLERQRLVGQDSGSLAGEFHRGGRDRQQVVVCRWDDYPSPSVCCRWGKKRDPEEPVDHALGH